MGDLKKRKKRRRRKKKKEMSSSSTRPLIQGAQQYAQQLAAEVDVQMVEYILGCTQHIVISMELQDGATLMALKL